MSRKIKFDKENFKVFLKGLSNINDSAILNVKKDNIYAISTSEDRSMSLLGILKGSFDEEAKLNVPSLKKLLSSLNLIKGSKFEFAINSNNLEFLGDDIRFKYHLYSDNVLVESRLTAQKIKGLEYDYSFDVESSFISNLLKQSSTFNDTNKLYLYTEDGKLVWMMGDKTKPNSNLLISVGEDVDFVMENDFIMNLDNIRLLALKTSSKIKVKINKIGVGSMITSNNDVYFNYVVSSLVK